MVDRAIAGYMRRRLKDGEGLSELMPHLLRAGYTETEIKEGAASQEGHAIVREKVLSLNPKALPSEPHVKMLRNEVKRYSKPILLGAALLFATLLVVILSRMDFSKVVWRNNVIAGLVYFAAFALLVSIQALLVYSIHRISQAHSFIQFSIGPIFVATVLGHVFTFFISRILPAQFIWISVLVGGIICGFFLIASFNSTGSEIISACVIYCALTYFFYILIIKIYTYDKVLLLFGIVV